MSGRLSCKAFSGALSGTLKEIYRILEKDGYCIFSTFTNDVITDDLIKTGEDTYQIKNRPPMVLLSKSKVREYVKQIGFKNIRVVDEHITDVGGGKRNVYTLSFKK